MSNTLLTFRSPPHVILLLQKGAKGSGPGPLSAGPQVPTTLSPGVSLSGIVVRAVCEGLWVEDSQDLSLYPSWHCLFHFETGGSLGSAWYTSSGSKERKEGVGLLYQRGRPKARWVGGDGR